MIVYVFAKATHRPPAHAMSYAKEHKFTAIYVQVLLSWTQMSASPSAPWRLVKSEMVARQRPMFREVLVSISFMCIHALLILTSIDCIVLALHSLAFWGLVPLEAIQTGLIVIAIQPWTKQVAHFTILLGAYKRGFAFFGGSWKGALKEVVSVWSIRQLT
jgi:hypothetical protein